MVPVVMYGSQVRRPNMKMDLQKLQKAQDRFLRRVEFRCPRDRGSLFLPLLVDRLDEADMQYLVGLIKNEGRLLNLFDLRRAASRAGFVIKAMANNISIIEASNISPARQILLASIHGRGNIYEWLSKKI